MSSAALKAGSVAVITGGASGIGLAAARRFLDSGLKVCIADRDLDRLMAAGAQFAERDCIVAPCDVGTPQGQRSILSAVRQVDILVNNNGGPPYRDFRKIDRQAQLTGLINNMVSPIELIQAVIDGMVERRFGRIVNITSHAVKAPIAMLGLSNGARSGLTGFVAGLARATAEHNVTINNLLPGTFDTDRLKSNLQALATNTKRPVEEVTQDIRSSNPSRRFGRTEEFGATCAFLCSAQAGYITGQNILIDGGSYPGTF